MPEYLYPGVYVEAADAESKPIPGVSTSVGIGDPALAAIADDLRRTIRTHAPDWTNLNESDPGVTLVELFAFLSESLLYRADRIPERVRGSALRAAAALAALGQRPPSDCHALTRPVYYAGRLLDAGTLTAEQEYQREKLRRHNRALLGFGIVTGLSVRVEPDASGGKVVVDPGYAIDPRGEEISVPCSVAMELAASGESAFVTARFWERPCDEPTRIEEACVLAIVAAAVSPAIALARLVRPGGVWQMDPTFAPARVRPSGVGNAPTGDRLRRETR